MIELILLYYMIAKDSYLVNDEMPARLCQRIQVVSTMLSTREVYDAAEEMWAEDESELEQFYAFWENRDSCDPKEN